MSTDDTLERLAAVIDGRRGADPDKSYVARLFAKGEDAMLKKVGEEATEVVMAAKDGDAPKLVEDRVALRVSSLFDGVAHGSLIALDVEDDALGIVMEFHVLEPDRGALGDVQVDVAPQMDRAGEPQFELEPIKFEAHLRA